MVIEYLEKTLHHSVIVQEYQRQNSLPLILSSNYNLHLVMIAGHSCVFAKPVTDVHFSALRKHYHQLQRRTGEVCVLYLRKVNAYAKDCMVKEGIPFVVEEKQIYLPFLGLMLSEAETRILPPCEQISFLTQKLLLTAIYEKWKDVSVSMAANKLGVTKTSITRCYDEIEGFDLPYIHKKSRARLFSVDSDLKKMWIALQDILRTPVLQRFCLAENLTEAKMLSGISALSYYSMLADDSYPVYAVSKKEISALLRQYKQVRPQDSTPGCILQEVGYLIRFEQGQAVDPLSVALMLADHEAEDPRVSMAIDEMLEERVW